MRQDDKTGGFASLGEFLVKVRKACLGTGSPDSRLKTAGHMEEHDDAQGGFLVPEQWADEIRHIALEDAIVRPRAIVLPTNRDSLKVRVLNETNRSTVLFGGVTFNWIGERDTKGTSVSKPAIGELELNPHKLVGGTWVSNELEDDYGQFGNFMKIAFGKALRFIEDDSFIWGTGAGMPQGIVPSGAMISLTRSGNLTLDWTDIANMADVLLPDSWNRAVWLINPDALGELLEATATAANQVTVWDASRNTIRNRPIIVSEKCGPLGSQGDIILADFAHYVIADREMYVAASRHVDYGGGHYGFATDETFWKIVLRVDGQPLMEAPITPYRGANPLSAFVTLGDTS